MDHLWKKDPNSFCSKYNVNELLYFEEHDSSLYAIQREKQLKKWRREKKLNLIKTINPEMKNIFRSQRDPSAPYSRSG